MQGGYYSEGGAKSSTPAAGDCHSADGKVSYKCGPCPKGNYCPGDKGLPVKCPIGTYAPATGYQYKAQCVACDPGYYCNEPGQDSEKGPCHAGFYCNGSSEVFNPDGTTGWGGPCTPGHYCQEGSISETPCPGGSFANVSRMSACLPCPAGYYCDIGASVPVECPAGHYCPENSTLANKKACPAGKFNNQTGAKESSSCRACPAGKPTCVCTYQGLSLILLCVYAPSETMLVVTK